MGVSENPRCEHCGSVLTKSARPLTPPQMAVLAYVTDYIAANGYAPSFAEIAERFNYRALATVHEHLTNLERKGWIRRAYNEWRAITVLERYDESPAASSPER